MNSNLFHNIVNVLIVVIAACSAALVAAGCTTLSTGNLDCSASMIGPQWGFYAVAALGALKVIVNIARDGVTGLSKPQPPVDKAPSQ